MLSLLDAGAEFQGRLQMHLCCDGVTALLTADCQIQVNVWMQRVNRQGLLTVMFCQFPLSLGDAYGSP
jgi:hypothetical protein